MNLEDIILTKMNQSEKYKHCMIVLIWDIKKQANSEQNKMEAVRGGGKREEQNCSMDRVSVLKKYSIPTTMYMYSAKNTFGKGVYTVKMSF